MKYTETLTWILDKIGVRLDTLEIQEQKFQENIDFVHSLGLKCDSVGWCELDLSNPRTPEIFNSISAFCKENGWRARGLYERQYIDIESDWYELVTSSFKDNTTCGSIETITDDAEKIYTDSIRAFHELSPTPKQWGSNIYVPDRFRNFCIRNNIHDLDFCWVKDKGKYEAEQYFHVYGKHLIPHIAVGNELKKSYTSGIQAAGGWLPEVASILYEIQQINLQNCYLASDFPDSGIAYAYTPPHSFFKGGYSWGGKHIILIHKDIATSLLQEKGLSANSLRPAPIVKELPGGYSLENTQRIARPSQQFMDMMLDEYEKLKNTPRPIRIVSEKDALKVFRLARKERKEEFQKAMTKAKRQFLIDTKYNALIPYYAIANGGFLSDEYELLPFAHAMAMNEEFHQTLAKEELLETKPDGIVIAKCPDGDVVLLCSNGEVARFSHEVPEILEQWPTLSQFFVDTINE